MKTCSDSFSLRRLWMLIRWDFGTNWKVYAWRYLGLYLTFLALMMMLVFAFARQEPAAPHNVQALSIISALVFMLLSFRSARLVMEQMITKEGRTAFLMIPASNLEKFVWRAFFASVFYLFMGIVAYALADLSCYSLCLLSGKGSGVTPFLYFGNYVESLVHILFDFAPLGENLHMPNWTYWVQSLGYFIFSLFLLLGCYWNRLNGLRVLAGFLLIVWGTPELLKHFAPEGLSGIYVPAEWVNGVFGALSILCWLLAYRSFRRSQIV